MATEIRFSTGLVKQNEGDEGTTEFSFSVERTGDDLSGTSTVDVAFVSGDTDAGDFGGTLPETQTLTFDPGETLKDAVITVSGDIDPESDEMFGLRLESATGAVIDDSEGGDSAFGIINNDDGFNVIEGTNEDDYLRGTRANDLIRGFAGVDILEGRSGNDILNGGIQDDILYGDDGDDILIGRSGNDILDGGQGEDILLGGIDEDILKAGSGRDIVNGGDGDDFIFGAGGDDILTGGQGGDLFDFSGPFGDDIITDFDDTQDRLIFGVADDSISIEVQSSGTLITVTDESTFGTVFLLGVTDFNGIA